MAAKAGLVALEVLSMALGVVELVPMIADLVAPTPNADATTVRLILGSMEDKSQSLGGNRPGVSLWDQFGSAIGFTPGSSEIIGQGSLFDVIVNPRKGVNSIQPAYVSITNGGDDAICLSGIALSFRGGGVAGFSTNIAATCGAFWSNSKTPIFGEQISGEVDTPKCVWLDRDGSNGIPHQGMGIHLPSFSKTNKNLGDSYTKNQDLMCKSGPRFRMYPQLKTEDSILVFRHDPEFLKASQTDDENLIGTDVDPASIIGNPGILAGNLQTGAEPIRDPKKRSNRQHSAASPSRVTKPQPTTLRRPLAERLVISPHKWNTARELCESSTSYGQSFVSLSENLFCDMTDKSLYYVCSDNITSCCLDADKSAFRACDKTSSRPEITTVNGTAASHSSSLRGRGANINHMFDSHWEKRDKVYDSVERWGSNGNT